MKKFLIFLFGYLLCCSFTNGQRAILVSMDSTLEQCVHLQTDVLLHKMLSTRNGIAQIVRNMKEYSVKELGDTTVSLSEIEVDIPKSDLPLISILQGGGTLEIPVSDELFIDNCYIENSPIEITDTTILLAIFPHQCEGLNVRVKGTVRKLTNKRIAASAQYMIPLLSYHERSYYWKDEKLAALIIL